MSSDANPKAALRRMALDKRRALPPETQSALSERLVSEGLGFAESWSAVVASAFHPMPGEPDTLALLNALANAGVQTALPVVASRGSPLRFRSWRPGEPTQPGPMAIAEPVWQAPVVEPDLLFVPLACFDRRGHRIGYGAGYYDRSLRELRALKPIHAVGVAYSVCEIDAVPYEEHDQVLDAIVTERETILVRGR